MIKSLLTTILISCSFNSLVFAAGEPTRASGLSSAKLLPEGVRNFTMKAILINPEKKFASDSNPQVLADPLNKNINGAELLKSKLDLQDRYSLEQKMMAAGLDKNTEFIKVEGQVNASVRGSVPVFAIGVTPKTTVAVAIPVIQSSVNIDSRVEYVNPEAVEKLRQEIRNTGTIQEANEFEEKMRDPVGAKAREYGYKSVRNRDDTKLGDVQLVLKRQLLQTKKHDLALQSAIALPTAEQADPDLLVDIPGGDGQTDLAVALAHDFHITENLDLLSFIEYRNQLSDKTELRVPESRDSRVSPDKEKVTRDLGDMITLSLGSRYSFYSGVNLAYALNYQTKQADQYNGTKYASERYNWMERDTANQAFIEQYTIGYSTIAAFKRKQFPVPINIGLSYLNPISGRNMVSDPSWALDLSLFF